MLIALLDAERQFICPAQTVQGRTVGEARGQKHEPVKE